MERLCTAGAGSLIFRSLHGKCLGHAEPGMAGRSTLDPTENPIAETCVKAGSLKGDRVEHGGETASMLRLPFRPFHDLTADPMTSQPIGQEERIDEEQAERGSPEQTSNHLLRGCIGNQNGERS